MMRILQRKIWLFLAAPLLWAPSPLYASTVKSWSAGMNARSTDDTLSSSNVVGFNLNGRVLHDFSPSFSASIKAGTILETGSATSLFTDEFAPNSGVFLHNASIESRILPELSLYAGAIEQDHHESPLVIASGTFPAIREILQLPTGFWLFHLSAQQAIPTSKSLSSKNTGKEQTPVVYTEKAALQFSVPNGGFARARVSHFNFINLTRGVAQDSRFYGNTIAGSGLGSQFVYNYRGWEYGGELSHPIISSTRATLGGSLVKNLGAAEGINNGRYLYAEIAHQGRNFLLAPRFELYRNEEDASPAFYTSREFGHNNRDGYGASLKFSFLKSNLDVKARWMKTQLITPQPFQRDEFQYFELSLETPYANF